jgi:outer membrane protein assembly factor BamE
MRIRTFLFTMALLALLASCTAYDFSRRVHEQGNLLPAAEISQLKLGMSKETAAKILGTSLMSPTFNNDRWDYAYTWRKGSGPITVHHLSLEFKNEKLVHIYP